MRHRADVEIDFIHLEDELCQTKECAFDTLNICNYFGCQLKICLFVIYIYK